MWVLSIEKSCFEFISRFYFYLWPFPLGWDANYTLMQIQTLNFKQKCHYNIWLLSMLFYSATGTFIATFYNRLKEKQIIPVMDAVLMKAVILAVILVWILTQILCKLVTGLNEIGITATKLQTGSNYLCYCFKEESNFIP